MEDEMKIIYQTLSHKYNKQALTKKELSRELGISMSSVNHYLSIGKNLPQYKKFDGKESKGNGGKVYFPISEIAKFLVLTNKIY